MPFTSRSATSEVIVLVPAPTSDPRDPLNFSPARKLAVLCTVCFASFAAACSPTSFQQAYVVMATESFHRPPIDLSYGLSAALAGVLAGPILLIPLAHLVGTSSVIFWSLLATLACQIWAAVQRSPQQYISFILSRLFAGLFGSAPLALGTGHIMRLFFLHQRGKAFAAYELSFLFGVTAGPTFSGFIAQGTDWAVCFWWTIAPLAVSAILVLIFLREQSVDRHVAVANGFAPSRGLLRDLVDTFLPGSSAVPPVRPKELALRAVAPFLIGIAPATILAGLYTLIAFGFTTMILTLLAIFLQTPVAVGGYGFSPSRSAAFTFIQWFSLLVSWLWALYTSDQVPLWLCRRFGDGVWRPEYRVWNMMLPAIIMPIGLGIFGAALQYHLHYMVLALGLFLCNSTNLLTTPVLVNYIIESHIDFPLESSAIMGVYRLALGVGLNFFIEPWIARIGVGWTFGMAAFFCVFGGILLVVLATFGPRIRHIVPLKSVIQSEEGLQVVTVDQVEKDGDGLDRLT